MSLAKPLFTQILPARNHLFAKRSNAGIRLHIGVFRANFISFCTLVIVSVWFLLNLIFLIKNERANPTAEVQMYRIHILCKAIAYNVRS